MIKSVKWFFVVLLVFSSLISLSFRKESIPAEGLVSGDKMPALRLRHSEQVLSLPASREGFTLLSFWASYDAVSREKNAALLHEAEQFAHVKVISVSFDRYASVFRAAVRQDQLDATDCFVETDGTESEAYRDFGLERGFGNYLINGQGVIVAKDIDASELSSFVD